MKPSTSSYRWFSCPAAMGGSPLCFMNFTSTRYRERLILYSLYPILDPCSFSKFITCCLRPLVGLSLPHYMWFYLASVSPPKLLSWAFLYSLLWFYPFPSAPFPCGNICLVHSCSWCCKFLHTLQYSVFTSSWRSFSNSPAPSVPYLHFRNTFSLLPYMCISYSSNLISSKSFASQYCFLHMLLFPVYVFVFGCLTTMSPTRKSGGGIFDSEFRNLSRSSVNLLSMFLKWRKTLILYALLSKPCLPFYYSSPTEDRWSSACP